MRFREFLKEFARSLKSGRLHKLLRLFLVFLFLFFGYRASVDVFKYWLKKKEQLSFVERNLKWNFDWRKGELSLKADFLYIQTPKFSGEFYYPEVDLSVYRSFRELKPVISFVGFNEGKLFLKGGKRKKGEKLSFRVPVILKKVEAGRLIAVWPGGELQLNRLVVNDDRFFCGGIDGKVGNRRFSVYPFSGYREGDYLVVPELLAGYDGISVKGSLRFRDPQMWSFRGSISSRAFSSKIIVKNYGKLTLNWKGTVEGIPTEGFGTFSVGRKIRIEQLRGRLDGALFTARGTVSNEIDVRGNVDAESFRYKSVEVKSLKGTFQITGELGKPVIGLRGGAKQIVTPAVILNNPEIKGDLTRQQGRFELNSEKVKGTVTVLWKSREARGNIELKNFELSMLTPVKREKEKLKNWIPAVTVSGKTEFSVKNSRVSYRGKLTVNRLFFQGVSGKGRIEFRGNRKQVEFYGNLNGKEGEEVSAKGVLFIDRREVESSLVAADIPLEKVAFLRKLGLSGKVDGRGRLWGSLKNPRGEFSISSKSMGFRGINLGETEAELTLVNYTLQVVAVSEKGTLDLLKVGLKGRRELLARGKVRDVKGSEVERLLQSFKVRLPFSFKGEGDGSFQVSAADLKEKNSLVVKVHIDDFNGEFNYDGLTAEGSAGGDLEYAKGKVSARIGGELRTLSYRENSFRNGRYSVTLQNSVLTVRAEGVSYDLKGRNVKNSISGTVSINLKTRGISGKGKVEVEAARKNAGRVKGDVSIDLSGLISDFTVKISGKFNTYSPFTGTRTVKIKGNLVEPKNLGLIVVKGKGINLKIIASGKNWFSVGFIKDLEVKNPKAKVVVNMAFVNLNLTTMSGTIAVPAFKIYPTGFYPLYSVSGLYINLKNGKPDISNITLSYLDGWIKIENISLEKGIKGKFEGDIGVKGLVYLAKAQKFVTFARNSLKLKGSFSYEKELHYSVRINGSGIEIKTRYLLDRAVANSLKATVKDGKVEELSGELTVGGGEVIVKGKGENFNITASLVPVGEINRWKGLISGKLIYERKSLNGTLTVSKARVILGKEKKKSGNSGSVNVTVPINININILFDEPLKIKGELFSLTIVPKLWIKTISQRLTVGGTFYVTDGKIDYMGKIFKVIYGSGTIEDLTKQKGRISILASAYISGYYVYMKIEGELNNLTIYLSSDPPLTREQILNLIMTGASPEEIEASSELFPAVQVAYYATASLFKPVEAKFKKTLKLESFSIEPYITKYGETVAKLTIAKRLAKRIRLVGYGTTGQNPEYGGSIQIFLNKNYYLELRYNSYYGPEAGVGVEVIRK